MMKTLYSSALASGAIHGSILGFVIFQGICPSEPYSRDRDEIVVDCSFMNPGEQESTSSLVKEKKALSKSEEQEMTPNITMPPQTMGDSSEQIIPFPENLQPIYPEPAREQSLEGEVILVVMINQTGAIESVTPAEPRCHPLLEKAAVEAIKHWRFTVRNAPAGSLKREISIKFCLET